MFITIFETMELTDVYIELRKVGGINNMEGGCFN